MADYPGSPTSDVCLPTSEFDQSPANDEETQHGVRPEQTDSRHQPRKPRGGKAKHKDGRLRTEEARTVEQQKRRSSSSANDGAASSNIAKVVEPKSLSSATDGAASSDEQVDTDDERCYRTHPAFLVHGSTGASTLTCSNTYHGHSFAARGCAFFLVSVLALEQTSPSPPVIVDSQGRLCQAKKYNTVAVIQIIKKKLKNYREKMEAPKASTKPSRYESIYESFYERIDLTKIPKGVQARVMNDPTKDKDGDAFVSWHHPVSKSEFKSWVHSSDQGSDSFQGPI